MDAASTPLLSVVVLTWNGLDESRSCVASIRDHTDVDYELIIVDNGSDAEAAAFAAAAADRAVLNEENRGFAPGMNQGLAAAQGTYIAFCNNDLRVPRRWASRLIEDFENNPRAGIVVPAVTAAGNPCTVRSEPGDTVESLLPFGEFPSGVLYVMRREVALALGGWSEEYPRASSEDLDLSFKVWANDLDIVLDERVLVDHTSQASVQHLDDQRELYRQNLERFLDKWGSGSPDVPRLATCDPATFQANLGRAATAIRWVRRLIATRDELRRSKSAERRTQHELERCQGRSSTPRTELLRRRLADPVRRAVRPIVRRLRRT